MTDLAFLFFIVIFALLTPKNTDAWVLNRLLAGKFAIFISLFGITLWLGFEGGWWEDVYRACLDLVFLWLFYKAGGKYLAYLCGAMFSFHIFNVFAAVSIEVYQGVMITFQVLQLMWASWGASDGIINLASNAFAWCNNRFHGHTRH